MEIYLKKDNNIKSRMKQSSFNIKKTLKNYHLPVGESLIVERKYKP